MTSPFPERRTSLELQKIKDSFVTPIQNQLSSRETVENVKTTILFEGVKSFWRSGKSIGAVVLEHKKVKSHQLDESPSVACIEVIAYNPTTGDEAPHLHFSYSKLFEKAKERGVSADSKYGQDLIAKYVFNRIFIIDGISVSSEAKFHVGLLPLISDQILGNATSFRFEGDVILGSLPWMKHTEIKKVSLAELEWKAQLLLLEKDTDAFNAYSDIADDLTSRSAQSSKAFAPRRRWSKAISDVKNIVKMSFVITHLAPPSPVPVKPLIVPHKIPVGPVIAHKSPSTFGSHTAPPVFKRRGEKDHKEASEPVSPTSPKSPGKKENDGDMSMFHLPHLNKIRLGKSEKIVPSLAVDEDNYVLEKPRSRMSSVSYEKDVIHSSRSSNVDSYSLILDEGSLKSDSRDSQLSQISLKNTKITKNMNEIVIRARSHDTINVNSGPRLSRKPSEEILSKRRNAEDSQSTRKKVEKSNRKLNLAVNTSEKSEKSEISVKSNNSNPRLRSAARTPKLEKKGEKVESEKVDG